MEERQTAETAGTPAAPKNGEEPRANDIYTDPALLESAPKDPVQELLQSHWKQIVYAALAVIAITYFVSSFREAFEENLKISADHFSYVDSTFEELRAAQSEYRQALEKGAPKEGSKEAEEQAAQLKALKEKADAARTKFEQVLAEAVNQSREPYSLLSSVYQAKVARLSGDAAVLKAKAQEASRWESIKELDSFERLQSEYLALVAARGLVDHSEGAEEAKKQLVGIIEGGVYAAVPAAIALSELAATPQEKTQALTLLQSLRSRMPEQADLLRQPIERLMKHTAGKPANTAEEIAHSKEPATGDPAGN
ncbi:MAG: hypothetical protein J5J00_10140 [Deltaproteobacteria bacterium]|nr:hypothetical protein [Deltaproteobacteria bacterium]